MELAALIVSMLAVLTSIFIGLRALMLARHSNTMPVLIDLFREHRSIRFTEGRRFAYKDLAKYDLSQGLPGLPEEKQELIRNLEDYSKPHVMAKKKSPRVASNASR